MYQNIMKQAAVLIVALSCSSPLWSDQGEWQQSIDIYLLGPTIKGTAGIGPLDGDVDVDPSSVFDSLEGAFLGMYQAERDGWGVFVDIVYMDLESDFKSKGNLFTGSLGNTQFTSQVAATRRINEHWQLLMGGIYTNLDLSIEVSGPLKDRSAKKTESWWDPIVGARFDRAFSEHWSFTALTTVGGGVSSDLTWTATVELGRSLSERSSITFLYRYLDFDYEDGKGLERFKFDIAEHGPAIGWRYEF